MEKVSCSDTQLLEQSFAGNNPIDNKDQVCEAQFLLVKEIKTLFPDWQKRFPFLRSFKNHSSVSEEVLRRIFCGNVPEEVRVYVEFKNFVFSLPYKEHMLRKLQTCPLSPSIVNRALKSLNGKLKRKERELRNIESNMNVYKKLEILRNEFIKVINLLSDNSKAVLENMNNAIVGLDSERVNESKQSVVVDVLRSISDLHNNLLAFRRDLKIVYKTVSNLLQEVKNLESFYVDFSDIKLEQRLQKVRLELDRIKQEIKFWEYIKQLHGLVNKRKLHLKKALLLNFISEQTALSRTVSGGGV